LFESLTFLQNITSSNTTSSWRQQSTERFEPWIHSGTTRMETVSAFKGDIPRGGDEFAPSIFCVKRPHMEILHHDSLGGVET
jgi:hypothetical protein